MEPLEHLSATERECVRGFVNLLTERLSLNLVSIILFGSAVRGDMWPEWSAMHSDIDLLIVLREPLSAERQEELINETYPLFLECGRQISPQFITVEEFESPRQETSREFFARVREEGKRIYPEGAIV